MAMNQQSAGQAEPQTRRTAKQVLLSYFYWTYSRGRDRKSVV